jgi:hypothetical protein
VLRNEDLAGRWDSPAYRDFLKELGEAVALARRALDCTDAEESHELWRKLLGKDFPKYDPSADGGGKRTAFVPTTPAPGYQRQQGAPRRERYGC